MKTGILYTLMAGFSFAVMGIFIKELSGKIPDSELLFARFFVSLLIIIPIILKSNNFKLKVKMPMILILRCTVAFLAIAFYFYSLKYVRLINVVLLTNTAPIFVPLVIFVIMRRKTSKKLLLAIFFSFIGITIIIKPTSNIFVNPSIILALISGIFAAMSIVLLKIFLIFNRNRFLGALFYYFLFSSIISGICMLFDWITPNLHQVLILLCIGISGALYQFLMILALKYISSKLESSMMFSSVVFAGLLGWLIYNITPTIITIMGIAITISGAILIIILSSKEGKKKLVNSA